MSKKESLYKKNCYLDYIFNITLPMVKRSGIGVLFVVVITPPVPRKIHRRVRQDESSGLW